MCDEGKIWELNPHPYYVRLEDTGGGELMEQVYLCPKCLEAQDSPGVCPRDGTELLTCRTGSPDDPCRRPLMDSKGRIVSRAPIWWLQYTVRNLMNHFEDLK